MEEKVSKITTKDLRDKREREEVKQWEKEQREKVKQEKKEAKEKQYEEDLDGDEPVTKEEIKQFKKEEREKAKKKKEPSTIQNIGRNVGNYVAKNSGQPSWLGRGGGMPPAMRMGGGAMPPALRTGVGKLPPAYSMGMGGEPPAWLFGGMPGAPVPAKGKKQKGNGLPSWFRY